MEKYLGTFVLLLVYNIGFGQADINKVVRHLDNNNLKFELRITSPEKSSAITIPAKIIFVKSTNVQKLIKRYGEKKLVEALVPCMNDTTKDWYASMLLYAITQKEASIMIGIENRDDWIKYQKKNDLSLWAQYQEQQIK
jgi:hypothetical protein